MRIKNQIKEFLKKYDIENDLKNSFLDLLAANSCEDLNIKDKKLHINEGNIVYIQTEYGFHLFKTPILKKCKAIGYYAIEYDTEYKIVDDFFVIFDKIEILINEVAQNKINFQVGINMITEIQEFDFQNLFNLLQNYIFNSIIDKQDYNSDIYQEAINTIPLKKSFTPLVILSKYPIKIAFNKLSELHKSEHIKIITSLLWIFKTIDSNRRETICKNGCNHFWHNIYKV